MSAVAGIARSADATETGAPRISTTGIVKRFGRAVVLDGIDFSVNRGEVHALVGKNGAGKSTFLKILSGAQPPDAGTITVDGRSFAGLTPLSARRAGISTVYQNARLHLDLSVAQNIFLGGEPRTGLVMVDDAAMQRKARGLLDELGLSLDASARLGDLDIALRQQVAIARAVRERAAVLLLDEPTSALNAAHLEFLFRLIGNVKQAGVAIVYVSHFLDEVLKIADCISVFRDGSHVAQFASGAVSKDDLIETMVGREVERKAFRRTTAPGGAPLLSVDRLTIPATPVEVSFDIARGEVVGLTGLIGAGARAIVSAVAGVGPSGGTMTLDGQPYAPRTVEGAIGRGVAFIPEDMRERGLVMPSSLGHNISLSRLRPLARFLFLDLRREAEQVTASINHLQIVPRDPDCQVALLSGGNQRKVLIARALLTSAVLLVLEEPTQGVDVEARRQIHEHLRQFAEAGRSVLFVSTDLEELIDFSDRILVLRDGRIDRQLSPDGLTTEALLAAIQGSELHAESVDV